MVLAAHLENLLDALMVPTVMILLLFLLNVLRNLLLSIKTGFFVTGPFSEVTSMWEQHT